MTTTHNNWEEEFDNLVSSPTNKGSASIPNWYIKRFISQTIHKALEAHKEEVKNDIKDIDMNSPIGINTHQLESRLLNLPSLLKDNK